MVKNIHGNKECADTGVEILIEDPQDQSDGYHTFRELYEHRHALFIALMRSYPDLSWKSWQHADGSEWEGWFIAGMRLPNGDISYHMPARLWDCLYEVSTRVRGHEWDGHTSDDVVSRLLGWDVELV